MVFTVVFGVILALLSSFSLRGRASKLPTVEALRDYMPMDADQPYRKRLPWVAAILGTYQIIVILLWHKCAYVGRERNSQVDISYQYSMDQYFF